MLLRSVTSYHSSTATIALPDFSQLNHEATTEPSANTPDIGSQTDFPGLSEGLNPKPKEQAPGKGNADSKRSTQSNPPPSGESKAEIVATHEQMKKAPDDQPKRPESPVQDANAEQEWIPPAPPEVEPSEPNKAQSLGQPTVIPQQPMPANFSAPAGRGNQGTIPPGFAIMNPQAMGRGLAYRPMPEMMYPHGTIIPQNVPQVSTFPFYPAPNMSGWMPVHHGYMQNPYVYNAFPGGIVPPYVQGNYVNMPMMQPQQPLTPPMIPQQPMMPYQPMMGIPTGAAIPYHQPQQFSQPALQPHLGNNAPFSQLPAKAMTPSPRVAPSNNPALKKPPNLTSNDQLLKEAKKSMTHHAGPTLLKQPNPRLAIDAPSKLLMGQKFPVSKIFPGAKKKDDQDFFSHLLTHLEKRYQPKLRGSALLKIILEAFQEKTDIVPKDVDIVINPDRAENLFGHVRACLESFVKLKHPNNPAEQAAALKKLLSDTKVLETKKYILITFNHTSLPIKLSFPRIEKEFGITSVESTVTVNAQTNAVELQVIGDPMSQGFVDLNTHQIRLYPAQEESKDEVQTTSPILYFRALVWSYRLAAVGSSSTVIHYKLDPSYVDKLTDFLAPFSKLRSYTESQLNELVTKNTWVLKQLVREFDWALRVLSRPQLQSFLEFLNKRELRNLFLDAISRIVPKGDEANEVLNNLMTNRIDTDAIENARDLLQPIIELHYPCAMKNLLELTGPVETWKPITLDHLLGRANHSPQDGKDSVTEITPTAAPTRSF